MVVQSCNTLLSFFFFFLKTEVRMGDTTHRYKPGNTVKLGLYLPEHLRKLRDLSFQDDSLAEAHFVLSEDYIAVKGDEKSLLVDLIFFDEALMLLNPVLKMRISEEFTDLNQGKTKLVLFSDARDKAFELFRFKQQDFEKVVEKFSLF